MKVDIIQKSDRKITFLLEGTTPQFANAIRRISMVEIPNLAVTYVDFSKNDSVLYDETIAHRLALIPFVFNVKDFEFKETCSCEGKGCTLCEVVFAVNKKGPCTVYSKDIKSSNKSVTPLYESIPIVELLDGQEIKFAAAASLGTGRDHAKFTAAVSFYRYYPNVKMNTQVKNPEICIKNCPKNALDIKGNKATVNTDCDLCKECIRVAEPKDSLNIWGDDTKFIFTVESISGLNAEEILTTAIKILKDKASDLEKGIKKMK
ncbi:MAG: DNA-directed RNA polymerase subunit D [Nanoarchaeota archaeon]|nr:DNA-directed RNA polymerase subunit D [Nanoarchaeota archaeon]